MLVYKKKIDYVITRFGVIYVIDKLPRW